MPEQNDANANSESEKPPVVIDFADDEQKAHWLKIIDYHNDEIAELKAKVKEHEARAREVELEFFEDVPAEWDVIKVNGKAVYTRETVEGQRRVYTEDLKELYPKIYEELRRAKSTEKVRRIGK